MSVKTRNAVAKALDSYDGVAVFNAIRNSSPTLQSRYAEATAKTLKDIGYNLSRDNVNIKLEYLNGLLAMVSAVFVKSNVIENPLSDLIRGGEYYAFGDLIENIGVHVAQGVDPMYLTENLGTGKTVDPFVQVQPDTITEFFKSNLPLQYGITISEWQLARAFESAQGMQSLIAALLESVTNGINADLFIAGKNIMNAYINDTSHTLADGQILEVVTPTDETTGKTFVLAIKNIINAVQFPTTAFNPSGIMSTTGSGSFTFYVRPEIMNQISVDVLASAFNRDDLDLTPVDGTGRMRIKTLPDFGGLVAQDANGNNLEPKYNELGQRVGWTLNQADATFDHYSDPNEDVIGIIAGPDAFGMALRRQNYAPIYNPRAEYMNYWYNLEYWCFYSNMENVIIIKKAAA